MQPMPRPMSDIVATMRLLVRRLQSTNPGSGSRRLGRRLIRVVAIIVPALLNVQCLGDIIGSPDEPVYEVDAVALAYQVNVGDSIAAPTVTLRKDGQVITSVGWEATVLTGTDVMRVDTALQKLIVQKPGVATVRVRAVSTTISDTTLYKDFTLTGVVPRIVFGPGNADTAYSIGDTIQPTATPSMRSGVAIPGPTVTWQVVGSDSAAVLLDATTGRVRAVKNGTVRLQATTDTATGIRFVIVMQRATKVVVSPAGAVLNPTTPTTTLTATAYDFKNVVLATPPPFAWTSHNSTIASVHPTTGVVTGVLTGQATISASTGTASGDALVSVTVPVSTPVNLWAPMSSTTTANLNGVWGTSSVNVYAVGDGGVIRRWNGVTWQTQTSNTTANLTGVWGSSASNVYAVGGNGTLQRYNGTAWGLAGSGTTANLLSVWGAGPNSVFLGGVDRILSPGALPGLFVSQSVTGTASGIWGTSATRAKAVSGSGPTVWGFNGVDWQETQGVPGTGNSHAIFGFSPAEMYAIGGGFARKFDGTSWTISLFSGTWRAGWGSSPSDIYLVGAGGLIARYNPVTGAATTESMGIPNEWRGIWGHGQDVFVVGEGGEIMRGYRGASLVVGPSNTTLNAVGATQQMTTTLRDAALATISAGVAYTWTSSDTTVARVTAFGLVTAVSSGVTSITATAPGGVTGSVNVTVSLPIGPVASVTVSPAGATISGVGNTATFSAVARDANGSVVTGKTFTWSTRNNGIATQSSAGVATAVSSGQVPIEAQVDGVSGYALVTVSVPSAVPVNLWAPMTSGTAANLHSVWGGSPTEVYTVGAGGMIRKLNNNAWDQVSSPTSLDISRVTGFSPVDLFASSGGTGGVLSRNGSSSNWTTTLTAVGVTLSGIWVASPVDIFASAQPGGGAVSPVSVRRFNGSSWSPVAGGPTGALTGIWGTSKSDVYAVGSSGAVERFNGTEWLTMFVAGSPLNAVWGASPSSIIVVGASGAIRQFNGTAWQTVTSGTTESLADVWGSSPSDVYAVGNNGTIQRYNGSGWSAMTSGTSQNLRGIWGMSNGDVYAVGNNGTILRGVRGAAVTVTPSAPNLASIGATQQLTAVARRSDNSTISSATFTWASDNVAAVTVNATGLVTAVAQGTATICATTPGGAQGCTSVTVNIGPPVASIEVNPPSATLGGSGTTLAATAKDAGGGTMSGVTFTWSSLNPTVATVNASTGVVTPVGSGQVTIAASAGGATGSALVTVIPQSVAAVNLWQPMASSTSLGMTGTSLALNGVWGASAGVVWVVGENGHIYHWNGSAWQEATGVPALAPLKGIWGFSVSDVFTVGNAGTIVRFNGSTWSTMTSPVGSALNAVWGSSPSNVFAVGANGKIVRFNGTSWSEMTSNTPNQLRDVYGFSPTQVYAVGDNGTVLRYDGTSWASAASGMSVDEELTAVYGTVTSNLVAVATSGKVWTMNLSTSAWSLQTDLAVHGGLNALWGSAPFDIHAAGSSGAVQRFNGGAWATAQSDYEPFRGVWGTSVGEVWAVGDGGRIHRGVRNATITLSPSPLSLSSVGQSELLIADVRDAANTALSGVVLTWTSSNPGAATVSSGGDVAAVANGSTTVCATAPGGAQGCVSVTVGIAPTSIVVSPSGTALSSGTATLTAVAKDAGGSTIPNTSFVWSSLNPNVATVNASTGVVTRVASGQVAIAASSGGKTGYALVTASHPTPTPVNLWAPMNSGTGNGLNAVWASGPNEAWAVGNGSTVLRFNGTSWQGVFLGVSVHLTGIWGTGPSNVYAVGEPFSGSSLVVIRYDGSSWQQVQSLAVQNVGGGGRIWGTSPNEIFVAAASGEVFRYDGTAWSQHTQLATTLPTVWGTATDNIWATGSGGQLFRYNGSTWSQVFTPTSNSIRGIWGTSPLDVFIVGDMCCTPFGFGQHWDGSQWAAQSLSGSNFLDVWGTSDSEVFVAARDPLPHYGQVRRFNGTGWTTAVSMGNGADYPEEPGVNGVGGTSVGPVFAVGIEGLIMRGVRGATVAVTPATPTLTAAGNTVQLAAAASDASANPLTGVAFTWSSTDPAKATVNSTGLVTAVANGTTSVCAMAVGGAQGCTTVTVAPAVASIAVSPDGTLVSGGPSQFTATAKDAGGATISGTSFVWTSLNTNVATVNASTGVVTPVATGQASISASAGGVTSYALANVVVPVATPVNLWAPETSGTTNHLGVWAASSTDIFAVGGTGTIKRFDGSSWSTMSSPTAVLLTSVWGTSGTDVFAVGNSGTILRYNGASWSPMTSGITTALYAVWGTSPRDVFALGAGGVILHYDGSAWSPMTSGVTTNIRVAWGTSSSNVYAATEAGTVLRYNGTNWSAEPGASLPNSGGMGGFSGTDVWVVGDNGGVLRFNGTNWNASTTSSAEHLTGVWGSSASDVYAVGDNGALVRFNGSTWSTVNSGTALLLWRVTGHGERVVVVGASGTILRGVRGATVAVAPLTPTLTGLGATQQMSATAKDASNNTVSGVSFTWSSTDPAIATVNSSGLVTAVATGTTSVCATAPGGAQGCTTVTVSPSVASIVVTPSGATIASGNTTFTAIAKDAGGNTLTGVTFTWATLNDAVATVNASTGVATAVSSGQTAIAVTAGGVWGYGTLTVAIPGATPVNLWAPMTSNTSAALNDVHVASNSLAFAVGNSATFLRYDGTAWSALSNPASQGLHHVWAPGQTPVFAAGAGGQVLYYAGNAFGVLTSGTTTIGGLWAPSPAEVFATGNGGAIRHSVGLNANQWADMTSGTSQDLAGVWGTSPTDVYAVGVGHTILHYNGTQWSTMLGNPAAAKLQSIWGTSSSDIYAVGLAGTILHWTGASWVAMSSGVTDELVSVWGSSSSDVYATSTSGMVLWYNGSTWTQVYTGNGQPLNGISGTRNGDVIAVGNAGVIMRGIRGATLTVAPAAPTLSSIGATQQLMPTVRDASANVVAGVPSFAYTWSTTQPSVATVSTSGLVTAVANGTTNVCATAPGGAQGCTTVTVDQAAASITLSPNGIAISSGTSTLTGTAKDANNNTIAGQAFTWTSLNPNVASVNSSGVVSPVKSGQATVCAGADNTSGCSLVTVTIDGAVALNIWRTDTTGVTTNQLNQVWSAGDGTVFAVGTSGQILRRTGSAWSVMSTPTSQHLDGLWGTSSSNVFAAGENGVILRFNGTSWTQMTSNSTAKLLSVWGSSPNDVFATGVGGLILHYDGSTWSPMTSGTTENLWGVWGLSSTNVYAVGEAGVIRQYNGSVWSTMTSSTSERMVDVWGVSPNAVFAAGDNGVRYFNGATWAMIPGTDGTYQDVRGSFFSGSSANMFAVGMFGQLRQLHGTTWGPNELWQGNPTLHGVWATNSGDVFVVGDGGTMIRGVRGGSVTATPASPTLTQTGAVQQMAGVARDASNNTLSGATFTWSSATPSVATVSATGLVTAVANGTTSVCAKALGGAEGCTTVTVDLGVSSILVQNSGPIYSGTRTFSAVVRDGSGFAIPGKTVTWASHNTSVATVNSSSGVVSPVTSGQATISASVDGVFGYGTVTVAVPGATAVNLWATMNSPAQNDDRIIGFYGASSSDVWAFTDWNNGLRYRILRYDGNSALTWTQSQTGTAAEYYGLWGSTGSDIRAVGYPDGATIHWNGSAWTASSTGGTDQLNRVWKGSPTAAFAGTSNGKILRYDGSTWTPTTLASGEYLTSLWGSWEQSVYATFTASGQTKLFKFTGNSWTQGATVNATVNNAFGFSDVDIIYGAAVSGGNSALYRFDGTNFNAQTHPNIGSVNAIWGSSLSDIYAVGNSGAIIWYNGTSWSSMSGTATSDHLQSIWGTSNGDVFAGGTSGTLLRGVRGATIALTPASPTITAFGATQQMTATAKDASSNTVSGVTFTWSSSDETKATVNSSGLVTAVANGTTSVCATAPGGAQGCTTVTVDQVVTSITMSPEGVSITSGTTTLTATAKDANNNTISGQAFTWSSLNTSFATVNSSGVVTGVASGQVTISASADGVTANGLVTVALTGASAVNVFTQRTTGTTGELTGLTGTSANEVLATGDAGTIVRFDGSNWNTMTSGTTEHLWRIWAASSIDMFATRSGGHVQRFNGTSWSQQTIGVGTALVGIWGSSSSDVFVSGFNGVMYRFNGTSWSQMTSGTSQTLLGIWGTSRSNVFAVGWAGTILRYNGTSWSAMTSGTTEDLIGIWGTSSSDVFAVGWAGTILHFNGTSWSAMTSGTTDALRGVWGSSASDVYAVASSGRVLRYNGSSWSTIATGLGYLNTPWTTSNSPLIIAGGFANAPYHGYRNATVSVTPDSPTITAIGATQQMTATAKDASNNTLSGVTFTWSSSDETKATVNASGLVTAVANGTTSVCATAPGGAQGCTTVTVDQVATGITVAPGGASLSSGNTTFTATAKDANNNTISGQAFTWTSLNTGIATVNSSGVVTAVSSGQSTIRASADGVSGYALATVAMSGATPVNLWASDASGTASDLRAVWGASPSEIYATGNGGVVRRYNGSAWATSTTSISTNLTAVWGSGANDVFAGGTGSTPRVVRFNGTTWSTSLASGTPELYGLWGVSPVEVHGAATEHSAYKFDGTTWTNTDVPGNSGGTYYTDIWGSSSSNIWVVGTSGTIKRWNGTQWIEGGGFSGVQGVWGTGPNEAFFVGDAGKAYSHNGTSYTDISTGLNSSHYPRAVWGSSGSDLYAAGNDGKIFRYDGSSWTVTDAALTTFYEGIWGTRTGDVIVVGWGGVIRRGYRGATVTLSHNSPTIVAGSTLQLTATAKDAANNTIASATFTWSSGTPGAATVNSSGLVTAVASGSSAICATAPGGAQGCTTVDVIVPASAHVSPPTGASISGIGATTTMSAEARDGLNQPMSGATFTWSSLNTSVATVNPSTGVVTAVGSGQATIAATVAGITGYGMVTVQVPTATPVNLWASMSSGIQPISFWGSNSGNIFGVGSGGGIVLYDGNSWGAMTSGTTEYLDGVGGTSGSDVWAVGSNGTIRHFNGSSWSNSTSNSSADLNDVWAAAPNDVYAVGDAGTILHYNGSSWSAMSHNSTATLMRVWGAGPTAIFAVGFGGEILFYNGSYWTAMTSGTTQNLWGVWGTSSTNVFVAGFAGTIRRFDGNTWSGMTSGTTEPLIGIWGSSNSDIYATGAPSGLALRFNATDWSTSCQGCGSGLLRVWGTSASNVWVGASVPSNSVLRGYRGASVTVTPANPTIGGSQQMTGTSKDASNNTISGVTLTWTSTDANVATVDASTGLVTAVADGTTSVCATAHGGAQGCTTVTVAGVTLAAAHGTTSVSNSNVVTLTGMNVSGTNRLLICSLALLPYASTPTVTNIRYDNGAGTIVNPVQLGSAYYGPTGGYKYSTYYVVAPITTSSGFVQVTLSGNASLAHLACVSYKGVHQTTPFGTATTASGSSGSASIARTSNAAGSVPFGVLTAISDYLSEGGVTERQSVYLTGYAYMVDGNTKVASGNSHTFNWQYSAEYAAQAVMIRPANP
jgi:uncharacterized protein YjdB